jgi:hypothetical protein
MTKIFVPAMLPGEVDRYIESDGKTDMKIRTWPDGTTEFDRGGIAVFLSPGEIHEIGKVDRKHASHNESAEANNSVRDASPGLSTGNPAYGSRNQEAGAKNLIRDVEAGLRAAGLYTGARVHGEEDGVWGRRANSGLEKVLVWAQMQSGEEISGSYTTKTQETLKKMADQGKIDPQLVGAIEKLHASGQLDQHYGPKDVQNVAREIRDSHLDFGGRAESASAISPTSQPMTIPRLS